MFNKKMTCQEALMRDKLLFDMATYLVCKGMIIQPKNQEEFDNYHNQCVSCFNTLKKQIQHGEFTFEQIVDDIVARCGPVSSVKQNVVNLNSDEEINNALKCFEKEYEVQEENTNVAQLFENFFHNNMALTPMSNPFAITSDGRIDSLEGIPIDEDEDYEDDDEEDTKIH